MSLKEHVAVFGLAFCLAPWLAHASAAVDPSPDAGPQPASGQAIAAALPEVRLRLMAQEVLERNPELAAQESRARAAAFEAPQAGSLADPVASVTAFLMSPETRVGPQQASFALSQALPWFGKLRLRERAAVFGAAAAEAEAEAMRLSLLTETRRLYHELALVERSEAIVREDRTTLAHFEQLARVRYSSGVGLLQAVITIQAEIARDDGRLLGLASRRASLVAALNSLRDRPQGTRVSGVQLPALEALPRLEPGADLSVDPRHPALARADAELARAETLTELASAGARPNLKLGLSYTIVGRRRDAQGQLNPPEDNGRDILGVSGSVNLPLWHVRLEAEVEEATALRLAAERSRRAAVARLERRVAELSSRLTLGWDQLQLFDDVLLVQTGLSLQTAEAAYAAGTLDALALLDAVRTLLEVRLGSERTLTDYAIAVAELEQALGRPLAGPLAKGETS